MAVYDCINGEMVEIPSEEVAKLWTNTINTDHVKQQKRMERNRLLAETDWTQMSDVPEATKTKWISYRQELRDLPEKSGFPDVDFPTMPE